MHTEMQYTKMCAWKNSKDTYKEVECKKSMVWDLLNKSCKNGHFSQYFASHLTVQYIKMSALKSSKESYKKVWCQKFTVLDWFEIITKKTVFQFTLSPIYQIKWYQHDLNHRNNLLDFTVLDWFEIITKKKTVF